jgi:hypothetical protein
MRGVRRRSDAKGSWAVGEERSAVSEQKANDRSAFRIYVKVEFREGIHPVNARFERNELEKMVRLRYGLLSADSADVSAWIEGRLDT